MAEKLCGLKKKGGGGGNEARSITALSSGYIGFADTKIGKNVRANSGTYDFTDYILTVTSSTVFKLNVACDVYELNYSNTNVMLNSTKTSYAANTSITLQNGIPVAIVLT